MISGNYLSGDYVRHLPSGKAGWLQQIDRDDTWIVKTHATGFAQENWPERDLCKLPTPNLNDLRLPDDVSQTVLDLVHIGQARHAFSIGDVVCLSTLPDLYHGRIVRFEKDKWGRDRALVDIPGRRTRYWWFVSGIALVQQTCKAIISVSSPVTRTEAIYKPIRRVPMPSEPMQQLSLF